jgi:hypothetical protein
MTKEIWEEYKTKKDKMGISFKICIFPGIRFKNSGLGLFAGSHDSYRCFSKLFDKVIEEYHGYSPNDEHITCMNFEQIEELSEIEQEAILSSRIRICRNFVEYPLGPGLT